MCQVAMVKKLALIFCFVGMFQTAWSQQIEIQGGGIVIAGDGTNVPVISEDTFFDTTPVSASRIHTFKLTNKGNQDARVESIRSDSRIFKVTGRIKRLRNNETNTFDLAFEPNSIGIYNAIVSIKVRFGRARKTYTFNVSGESSASTGLSEIMITQYYENGRNDQIEIKNLTDYDLKKNSYVLAKYNRNDNLNKAPTASNVIKIDRLAPGKTETYDGFRIRGNEIIIISKSRGKNCYADRVDMIGEQKTWGTEVSFSKGGCASESANTEYDSSDWVQLSIEEVDQALSMQNIFMGAYQTGPITWSYQGWTGNALPDRTRIVFIQDPYQGDGRGIKACDLTINALLDFDNDKTHSVVVYRDLTINKTFKIGDTESLVMYDDNANISGSIEKIERSTKRNNTYDFTYWSSPINNATLADVFSGVDLTRLYYYDQSQTDTSDKNHPDYWSVWVQASGKMENGRGYAAEGKSGETGVHEIVYMGQPNNGVIEQGLDFHDDGGANSDLDNDFNMLGNPYPSAIDIEVFFKVNKDLIESVVYLWTHATPIDGETGDYSFDDYASYNYTGGTGIGKKGNGTVEPAKNIGSSQGFFVRAKSDGIVKFNNSMRMENANDQFFKGRVEKNKNKVVEKDRIWLDLTTNKGGFNQILIGFIDKASDEFDSGFDALKFKGSNKIGFYSLLGEDKMTIQGFGAFKSSKEVKLGFDTKLGQREYTISISNIEGQLKDSELILFDHLLEISHDIKKSAYTFVHDQKGEFKDRFTLNFKYEVGSVEELATVSDGLFVTIEEDVFRVVAPTEVTSARLFDLQGRQIMQINPNQKSFEFIESKSKKGEILLLELQMKNKRRVLKKLYKH